MINKKTANATLEEEQRHNKALEESIKNGDGLYLSPNSPEWKIMECQ